MVPGTRMVDPLVYVSGFLNRGAWARELAEGFENKDSERLAQSLKEHNPVLGRFLLGGAVDPYTNFEF